LFCILFARCEGVCASMVCVWGVWGGWVGVWGVCCVCCVIGRVYLVGVVPSPCGNLTDKSRPSHQSPESPGPRTALPSSSPLLSCPFPWPPPTHTMFGFLRFKASKWCVVRACVWKGASACAQASRMPLGRRFRAATRCVSVCASPLGRTPHAPARQAPGRGPRHTVPVRGKKKGARLGLCAARTQGEGTTRLGLTPHQLSPLSLSPGERPARRPPPDLPSLHLSQSLHAHTNEQQDPVRPGRLPHPPAAQQAPDPPESRAPRGGRPPAGR